MGELPSTLPGSRGQDAPMDPSMPTPCPLLLNQATRCLAVDFQHTLLARPISLQWLPSASGDSTRGQHRETSPCRPSVHGTAPEESPEPLCLTFPGHTNPH